MLLLLEHKLNIVAIYTPRCKTVLTCPTVCHDPDRVEAHAVSCCSNLRKLLSAHAGGSAGIGRAVALGLSDNGAIVTVLARRKDRLDAVVKELHQVALSFTGRFAGVCATTGAGQQQLVPSTVQLRGLASPCCAAVAGDAATIHLMQHTIRQCGFGPSALHCRALAGWCQV